jgi:peptidoglycan pentaglycine glycine transferase (the first glycine)
MDYGDAQLVNRVLADLEQFARRSHAILLKIDPDVPKEHALLSQIGREVGGEGWRPSAEQIQFRNTMEIDLRRSEDELLAAMHQKTRYNIRLAIKRGVTVRAGTLADLELLYSMYAETARRDHFIIRPLEYYRDAWGSFIEAGLAQPLVAQVADISHVADTSQVVSASQMTGASPSAGVPVAALILFHFAGRAYYFYGMSLDLHRNLMPTYLLQWEAMRWARAHACTIYDMWGAPDTLDESDSMWGVYRFKQGFGGQFVQHIGAWDYAASRPFYWLYTTAMPRVLEVMRQRHWMRSKET